MEDGLGWDGMGGIERRFACPESDWNGMGWDPHYGGILMI